MSALAETLRALADVLDASMREQRSEGWYVFGAQAVAVRGAPRATQDVDVTVVVPASELPVLMTQLESVGLSHRYPDVADKLLASAAVLPLEHTSGMEIDLVVGNSGLERLTLERAERIQVEGVDVPIARATELVVMKILAGRGKDLDDVQALLASGDVDEAEVENLLAQLEDALGQSDLVRAFEDAKRELRD